MNLPLSSRLLEIVEALPLRKNMRILEIGCGPGAMARELARRIGGGYVLGIDRSAKAIQQAQTGSEAEIKAGILGFRQCAIEQFELLKGEASFDLVVAIRVGALDGRHPELEKQALLRIQKAIAPKGRFFIDGGRPLKEIRLKTNH